MAAPGTLTTHVLDTANGVPANGLRIDLFRIDGDDRTMIERFVTDADGRTRGPLLAEGALEAGFYELVFHVGAYFAARAGGDRAGVAGAAGTSAEHAGAPPFLDLVPVRFGVADAGSGYHVPLLVSPFGYSTYRGS